MENTNTLPATGITPEVGKRYVTRVGRITPPFESVIGPIFVFKAGNTFYCENGKTYEEGEDSYNDVIAEYVEPTVAVPHPLDPPDTFRRDLVAQIYVETVSRILARSGSSFNPKDAALKAIITADTLIEAMEEHNTTQN